MVRMMYRWKVTPGQEETFARAWEARTKKIRAGAKGSRGSLLLRSRRDPSLLVGVARWDALEDWDAFFQGEPIGSEELAIQQEVAGDPLSIDAFDEVLDLTLG